MHYCTNVIPFLLSLGIGLLLTCFKGGTLFSTPHCFLKVDAVMGNV